MADFRFEFLWDTECYEKIINVCFGGEAPENFRNFNSIWPPGANLTMEDVFIIIITISNFCRDDHMCGPYVWNKLPYNIRTCNDITSFKKLLKYHLFSNAFAEY